MAQEVDAGEDKASRPIAIALRKAVSDFKGLAGLFLAFGGVLAAYLGLQHGINLPQPWPLAGSLVPVLIFSAFYFFPEWRRAAAERRLRDLGIRGQLKDPGFFRLTPYRRRETDKYQRADNADETVANWIIENTSNSILYLYGQSGAGKSSLLSAGVTPRLERSSTSWIIVNVRLYDDPLAAVRDALCAPGAVWQNPPRFQNNTASAVLEKAERYAHDQRKRLLIIIDQFEECLILLDDQQRAPFVEFLSELGKSFPGNLSVVLSLRAEYLSDLVRLHLPAPTLGRNCVEVRPFTQAAARAFLNRSELDLGPMLLEEVLAEAAEIEDMPDRVRPIVLNMMGLVLASFQGILPNGVTPGRLLSGYVQRTLSENGIRTTSRQILKPLLTDIGTKRSQSLSSLAQQADLSVHIVRGCLIRLGDSGLVRAIDENGDRWEIAHDFVARLIQPILQNWRISTWEAIRSWLAPSALAGWIIAIASIAFIFPELKDAIAIRELARVGVVSMPSINDKERLFRYNGTAITESEFARALSYLPWLKEPVTNLEINEATKVFKRFAILPELGSLSKLSIVSGELRDFRGMKYQPALRDMKIQAENMTSLSGMPEQLSLTRLDLTAPRLDRLSELPGLAELVTFKFNGGAVVSLSGMPPLPSLKEAIVVARDVDLVSMPRLSSLERLVVASHRARLSGIATQPKLKTLQLSGSPARRPEMPQIAQLDELEVIIENQDDVDRIARMAPNIARLKLFVLTDATGDMVRSLNFNAKRVRNLLLDFSSLKTLTKLRMIEFSGDIPTLEFLLDCDKLEVVRINRDFLGFAPSLGSDENTDFSMRYLFSLYAGVNSSVDLRPIESHRNRDIKIEVKIAKGMSAIFDKIRTDAPEAIRARVVSISDE